MNLRLPIAAWLALDSANSGTIGSIELGAGLSSVKLEL